METSPVTREPLPANRRLVAILVADVAGYGRLVAEDEEGTLRTLADYRTAIAEIVAEQSGRIFGTAGDSIIVEFASAVNAVRAGAAIQRALALKNAALPEARRMEFRIGINLGDVVVDGDDLFGDGVNIAARLQSIANPAEIYISSAVLQQIEGKLQFAFTPLGERALKNVLRPVSVFRVEWDGDGVAPGLRSRPPALPDRPSIAVLPFRNLSEDAAQEYFADGMVEEITTALSRMRGLFVIARSSSFTYKGREIDVKQVGREMGVRYVLEGSVRKAGDRLRITGQLLDTATGAHLWADRFDGTLEDIFTLQDQVASSVIGAIAPKLEQAEIERSRRKPTESLDAYDYFLRGMAAFYLWTKEGNDEALALFRKAAELDPKFATAFGMAARCYGQRKARGWMADRAAETVEAVRLARRAAELGKDDAVALYSAGVILIWVGGDFDTGDALIEQALVLNPNLAWAWLYSGWVKVAFGEPELAIDRERRAMRLSPHDPLTFIMQSAVAAAHFLAGRYAEALCWAELSMREQPHYILSASVAAAAAAMTGNQTAAAKAIARLREVDADLRLSNWTEHLTPLRKPEHAERWVAALRKAGLPE
ncbi:MAG TPA: adenylate/guanylate cyclase domain-containing protein [Bauldia sp.]|nr:adenylate/guanylate cyclase domain-containing protein [Bauldia sp.]